LNILSNFFPNFRTRILATEFMILLGDW